MTYTFDLTDAAADGEKLGTVVMMDYAQNISQSDVLSLTSQDVEPVLVQINQQQITCMIDTQPFQLDVFVYPITRLTNLSCGRLTTWRCVCIGDWRRHTSWRRRNDHSCNCMATVYREPLLFR